MTHPSGIIDVLRIEIRHANGSEFFDPNSLIIRMIEDKPDASSWPALSEESVISFQPAVIYKTNEVEVPLTVDEIYRLTMRSLTPTEFHALKGITGNFFEIHDDFYDQTSGVAMQPKA